MSGLHIDLSIVDGDFDFNDSLSPAQLSSADVIAQDVKHRVLESGLLFQLIGLRNVNGIAKVLTEVELIVEQDDRLIPGSIMIIPNADKTISITANTHDYGRLSLSGAS